MTPQVGTLVRLLAGLVLWCVACMPCIASDNNIPPVSSAGDACAVLKQAAVEFHLSVHDLTGRYYCEPLSDHKTHFVLGLRYHAFPDELVGSNLIGWFAVAKSDGTVSDWDINEDRAIPLAPRQPFRLLEAIYPVEILSASCGCWITDPSDKLGDWVTPIHLFLDFGSKPPYALANLGYGVLRLRPIETVSIPLTPCVAGKKWISRWSLDDKQVGMKLELQGSGMNPGQFDGIAVVRVGEHFKSVPVTGRCRCEKDVD